MGEYTIADIAREAGVSKATVSRVINNSPVVTEETRIRVNEIIQLRNYIPFATARDLSKKMTGTVGVIVPDIADSFFGRIIKGICDVANENDLNVAFYNKMGDVRKDEKIFRILKAQRVCGILCTPSVDYNGSVIQDELNSLLDSLEVPVIAMDRPIIARKKFDGVYFDNDATIERAVMILAEKGYRRIAIINSRLKEWNIARQRQDGYLRGLRKAGIKFRENYVFDCKSGVYGQEDALRTCRKIVQMKDKPDAVITCSHIISLSFIRALRESRHSMSDDIACIGVDEIEALNQIGYEYNYIERDSEKLGNKAAELLLKKLSATKEDREAFTRNIIESRFVIQKL